MALTAQQATKGTIHISARRWFDRVNGNTYHSVAVTLPDGSTRTQGCTYGYGSHYEQTALELVVGGEHPRTARGNPVPVWQWYEDNGYRVVYDVVDVTRKRDLHARE